MDDPARGRRPVHQPRPLVPVQLHRPRRVPAGLAGRPDVRALRPPGRAPHDDHLRRDRDLDHRRAGRGRSRPGRAQDRAGPRLAPARASRTGASRSPATVSTGRRAAAGGRQPSRSTGRPAPLLVWRGAPRGEPLRQGRVAEGEDRPRPAARRSSRCRWRPSRPGCPRGIWTIESSESIPPRCWVGIGTPMTGRIVLAASMPGRWAAPPAPAMMTRIPRPRPPLGVAEQVVRRPMGRDDLAAPRARRARRGPRRPPRASGSPTGCRRRPRRRAPRSRSARSSRVLRRRRLAAQRSACAGRAGPRRAPRRRRARAPSRGPSCGVRRRAACRTGGGGRSGRRGRRRARRAAPSRARAGAEQVDHRGRRERHRSSRGRARRSPGCAARTATSAAPSIVQWPLLWTRGASSLTTRRPSRRRNSSRSACRQAHRHRQPPADVGGPLGDRRRRPGPAPPTRPGCPSSWTFRATGKVAIAPSMPRATMTESSASKSSSRSARSGVPGSRPRRSEGAVELGGRRRCGPGPGRRSRRSRPSAAAAGRGVGGRRPRARRSVRTSRHGATAMPAASTNRRSASRSWVTTSGHAARAGPAPRASSASTTSAATCSSS